MMETKQQRIRRRFRNVMNRKAYEKTFADCDKKKLLNLLCDWFEEHKRSMTREEMDELIKQSKN